MDKIGLGIVTHKREDYFKQVIQTIPFDKIDSFIIVNDGTPYELQSYFGKHEAVIQNESNLGVSKTKNKAIQFLMDKGCDHIFIMEDDILIKSPNVFEKYIEASKVTGIQHFNFGLHGFMNKTHDNIPLYKYQIAYNEKVNIVLYENPVGAFSYFTRNCIEKAGLLDEKYYNALEHIDHVYQIIKAGLHPPFWCFADIATSELFLKDITWEKEKSTIASRNDHPELVKNAMDYFYKKNNVQTYSIPKSSQDEILNCLQKIENENTI